MVVRSINRNNSRSVARLIMIVLVLLAFAWRAQDLVEQSLWRDEVDALQFALGDLQDTLSMFTAIAQNGALYFLILRGWLWLAGSSEFALRYPAVLFGVLSVPLLWQVARRLMPVQRAATGATSAGRELWQAIVGSPAMLAALFLAFNPYQLWYSQDGKMYALVTLLALLAAWFWLQGIGRGGWRPWLGFLLTVSVAIYTHLLMALLIPLFLIWYLIAWPQSKRHLVGFLMAFAGLTLPYLPLVLWQWKLITASRQLTSLTFIPLFEMIEALLLEHIAGITRPDNRLWLAPVFILGMIGLLLGYRAFAPRAGDPLPRLTALRRHLLIATWLLAPVTVIHLFSLRQPVFLPRYVIWIAPAAMMLVALGVQVAWSHKASWAKPLATVLTIYVVLFWLFVGWQQKSLDFKNDLRGAVTYINQRRQPDELLILQIPHMEYAYRYYSSDK